MSKITQVSAEEKSAARRLAETFSEETLDSLIKDAVKSGTPIDGADGLLNELTKAVLRNLSRGMSPLGVKRLACRPPLCGLVG